MTTNEIYPNSPLAEVVFEIRFAGMPAIECQRDKFYDKVKKIYPKVYVPHAKEGEAQALKPYKFTKEDDSSGVMQAINSFAYSVGDYKGYKAFKKEFLRLFRIFNDLYKIEQPKRIGWRYINIIPYIRSNLTIPIKDKIKFDLQIPDIPNRYENINIVITSELKDGHINFALRSVKNTKNEEALLIDLDYYKTENLKIEKMSDYIDESHSFNKKLFENLITDDYRQYLKGESL